jgi:hypothetical protein
MTINVEMRLNVRVPPGSTEDEVRRLVEASCLRTLDALGLRPLSRGGDEAPGRHGRWPHSGARHREP